MAMTNASPLDYKRRKGVGKPQKIKLCDACGAPVVYHREYRCTSCPNKSYVIVYEHEAADFRLDLMEAQERYAAMLAAEMTGRFTYFREMVALACLEAEEQAVGWMREPTDAELRAIDDEQELTNDSEWLPDSEGNFLYCPRCGDPYTTDNRNICLNCGLPIRYDEPPTSGEQADASYGTLDLEGYNEKDERNSRPFPF